MSADEELLLLSAVASAATISLVAFSCKRKRKRAERLWMRPFVPTTTQILRHVIPPNTVIGCDTVAS